jgi:hypothetical protein
MIEGIEISPSDRAGCNNCGKRIGKGTPRGIQISTYGGSHITKHYYCYKCFPLKITEEVKSIKDEFSNNLEKLQRLPKELDKLIIQQKKEIILSNL